jgi:hypothetical protein
MRTDTASPVVRVAPIKFSHGPFQQAPVPFQSP